MHDHPWNFWTYMISGSYYEYTPDAINYRSPLINRWIHRKATDLHKVVLTRQYQLHEIKDAPFTFFIAGNRQKGWGFMKNGRIIPWREYLQEDYNEHTKEVIERLLREQNGR